MGLIERVGIRGRVRLTLRDVRTGKEDIQEFDNLVVDAGKAAIAARLVGDAAVANRAEITFGAVGTGTNSPAPGDTGLQTEIFRKSLSLRSFSGKVATLRLFLTTAEGNGSLREFGLFGEDASATPGSGTLFNRVNINREKTASNTLTIDVTLTIG